MKIEVITEFDKLLPEREAWDDLVSRMENPQIFYHFDWFYNYVTYYEPAKKEDLFIVFCRESNPDRVVCIFPFVKKGSYLTFAVTKGTDYCSYYADGAVNRYSLVSKVLDWMFENYRIDAIRLDNFPSSPEFYLLRDALEKRGFAVVTNQAALAPFFLFSEIGAKGSKKKTKNIAYLERQLQKAGHEITYEESSVLDDETLSFIAENKNRAFEDSPFKQAEVVNFYRNVFPVLGEKCLINKLYIDGQLQAAHMGFADDRKIYYYIPTYAAEYAKYGPGMILLKYMMENAKTPEFDLLRGDESYKFYWGDRVNIDYTLEAFRKDNIKGKIYAVLQSVRRTLLLFKK